MHHPNPACFNVDIWKIIQLGTKNPKSWKSAKSLERVMDNNL